MLSSSMASTTSYLYMCYYKQALLSYLYTVGSRVLWYGTPRSIPSSAPLVLLYYSAFHYSMNHHNLRLHLQDPQLSCIIIIIMFINCTVKASYRPLCGYGLLCVLHQAKYTRDRMVKLLMLWPDRDQSKVMHRVAVLMY